MYGLKPVPFKNRDFIISLKGAVIPLRFIFQEN